MPRAEPSRLSGRSGSRTTAAPSSGSIRTTIEWCRRIRVGAGACSLAASRSALWIANYKRGLTRVTPRGRVKHDRRSARPRSTCSSRYGRVWVTAWEAGELAVVEPRTLKVVRRIDVGPRPVGLTARNGAVWVGFGRNATSIARVDPRTYRRRSRRGRRPRTRLVRRRHEGSLDPGQRRRPLALRPGRASGSRSPRGRCGRSAQGAVAPDGTIWMPDKERSVVYRVDPKRQRILDSFPAGPGAYIALRAYRLDVGHELRRERRAPFSAVEEGRRQTVAALGPRRPYKNMYPNCRGSDFELLERRRDRYHMALELELGIRQAGGHSDQLRQVQDRHLEVLAGPLAELRLPRVK